MEKVWAELKKIESQAEQIRSDAQKDAKEITSIAQNEAEKLILDGKKYGGQEAQEYLKGAVEEANRKRDQQLVANKQAVEALTKQAQQRMDKASLAVVSAVLGET